MGTPSLNVVQLRLKGAIEAIAALAQSSPEWPDCARRYSVDPAAAGQRRSYACTGDNRVAPVQARERRGRLSTVRAGGRGSALGSRHGRRWQTSVLGWYRWYPGTPELCRVLIVPVEVHSRLSF